MRKLKIRHQPLPHVGELFELVTASGYAVTIVAQRSGRRELVIRRSGEEQSLSTTELTRSESAAVAALLVGAHIELCTEA
jgi:K+/H+ antiporter YhaU regulatory subunit KhtT